MTKSIRILMALALLGAIVALGMNSTVWADKLFVGKQAPAAVAPQQGVFVPAGRPLGTVGVVNPTGGLIPITGGQLLTVGSCATVQVVTPPNPPPGVTYTAFVVPVEDLPKELPGNLISCAVKVVATEGTPSTNPPSMGADVKVCFPIPPTQAGFAYHWQSPWQKTTTEPQNGESCVIIPADAVNASYTGLFNK